MRLAYLLGTFPSLSETFILREMTVLRERGIEIEIFALNRRALPAKVHGAAAALLPTVHWRPAPRPEGTAKLTGLVVRGHRIDLEISRRQAVATVDGKRICAGRPRPLALAWISSTRPAAMANRRWRSLPRSSKWRPAMRPRIRA